jgi:hypothetical protein
MANRPIPAQDRRLARTITSSQAVKTTANPNATNPSTVRTLHPSCSRSLDTKARKSARRPAKWPIRTMVWVRAGARIGLQTACGLLAGDPDTPGQARPICWQTGGCQPGTLRLKPLPQANPGRSHETSWPPSRLRRRFDRSANFFRPAPGLGWPRGLTLQAPGRHGDTVAPRWTRNTPPRQQQRQVTP